MRKNAGPGVSGPDEPAGGSRQEGEATMAFGARPNSKGARPALGTCPLCGSEVVEQARSYGCSRWREGCKFAIWKSIAGKPISPSTARALLRRGQSPLLKGFRSRSGRPFEARLKLEEARVAALTAVLPDFEAFYASLTDQQKADLMPRMGRGDREDGPGRDGMGRHMRLPAPGR